MKATSSRAPLEQDAGKSRFVDLSHVLEDGMPVYPGLPAPDFSPIVTHRESRPRYGARAEFYLGQLRMPCNLGTYVDAPFHRFAHLEDLSRVALDALAGVPGVVAHAPARRAVVLKLDEKAVTGRAVLIRTGWDARWGTDAYWEDAPYLAPETIDLLVQGGATLVGVDFANIDDTTDDSRPAHTRLLRDGILVVEHLTNLGALPDDDFRFFAVPPKIVRGASFPVRAFAEKC